jgi:RimJ/RimL family protein N-acetyltransferase
MLRLRRRGRRIDPLTRDHRRSATVAVMASAPTLVTPRLLLRPWRDDDRPAVAAMSADAEVMAHFPALLDREASDRLVDRLEAHFERHGFGMWAVERADDGGFAGMIGLMVPAFTTAFTPCVEVGWRLARDAWGHGYAVEGAAAALELGFGALGLGEIVSFTTPANARSRRVMETLGMQRDVDGDFDHPHLSEDSPLRRHVLYRLTRDAWRIRSR